MSFLYVAIGGALGTLSRFGIANATKSLLPSTLPVATWIANISGCFLIGLLIGSGLAKRDQRAQSLIGVGFLGALTTFSTFSWETIDLIEQERLAAAGLNIGLSLVLGLLAVAIGLYAGRRLFPAETGQ